MHIDDEVTANIAKANEAFRRLRANILGRNGIKLDTKLKVCKAVAVVLPTLLYACETWTVYQRLAKRQPFRLKLFENAVKNQVARQDSRHGGPEESRNAKRYK